MKFIVMLDNTPCREFDTEADASGYVEQWSAFYGTRIWWTPANV